MGTQTFKDHLFLQNSAFNTLKQIAVITDGSKCSDHCAIRLAVF